TVTVEPLVKIGQLTRILISKGWTIPVVPELDFLTVGGLICGAGVETSSHKYVKLSYIPVNSLDEATERITKESLKTPGHDFIEGIMYSLDKGVIMVGSLTSKAEPGKVNSVARWYKKSFYKHVESFLSCSQSAPKVEYIPLRHYYHRHTYCIFWVTRFCIPYMEVAPLRWMLGWVAPCEMNWYKLIPLFLRRLFEENLLIQDHVIYPVWLCPAKTLKEPGFFKFGGDADKMHMDIGLYGMSEKQDFEPVKTNKALEQFCLRNNCWKGLSANTFLSRDEFYQMFDPTLYHKVRTELKCENAFPEVYEKVVGRK
ncbi:Delta(24)-sterol reductase, partial [Folsomia candida]